VLLPGLGGVGELERAGAGGSAEALECSLLDGTCTSSCAETSSTCTVIPWGLACEFEQFSGSSSQVACGETTKVGTASCGICGVVDVLLYFDGQHCWQGIPDCATDVLKGQLFRID
jgi:hypothetical protein